MRDYLPLPSQETLRELFSYNPTTGEFIWNVGGRGKRPNLIAGNVMPNGYRNIEINGQSFKAHRLAWMYVHNQDPGERMVDHINRKPGDDRIDNLRVATRGQNFHNSGMSKNNSSGFKGVHWVSRDKRWRACVWKGGKRHCGGFFECAEDANEAAKTLREKLHEEFCNHGT